MHPARLAERKSVSSLFPSHRMLIFQLIASGICALWRTAHPHREKYIQESGSFIFLVHWQYHVRVCVHVCVHACVYVCVYMCLYVRVCVHAHARGLCVLMAANRAICQRGQGTALTSCAHIASPRMSRQESTKANNLQIKWRKAQTANACVCEE